jgi:hypothetical protein
MLNDRAVAAKLTSSSCVYSFGWPVIGEPHSAQIVPIYGHQEHRLGREPGPIKARAASYQAMPPSKPLSTDASSAPRTAKQGGNKLHRQAGFLRGLFLRPAFLAASSRSRRRRSLKRRCRSAPVIALAPIGRLAMTNSPPTARNTGQGRILRRPNEARARVPEKKKPRRGERHGA